MLETKWMDFVWAALSISTLFCYSSFKEDCCENWTQNSTQRAQLGLISQQIHTKSFSFEQLLHLASIKLQQSVTFGNRSERTIICQPLKCEAYWKSWTKRNISREDRDSWDEMRSPLLPKIVARSLDYDGKRQVYEIFHFGQINYFR